MSGSLVAFALLATAYFGVLATLGILASRRSSRSPEEYFLAGRGLGKVVLFMALFGTNCTTFVLVAIPAVAWQHGVGIFGLNAAVVALGVPLTFLLIGLPARAQAARLGALTPAELYAKKLDSKAVGLVLFGAFTLYTIPYMVQGVKGTALVMSQATDGVLPTWLSGLCVLMIVMLYTSLGGMRGTAWTNVFQGALFMLFMACAFVLIPMRMGGFGTAMEKVRAVDENLLRVGGDYALFQPTAWASWGLVISTTVIAFPHMLSRLLSAADDETTRSVCRFYPLALVALWIPAVLLGVLGRGAFPELERPDTLFYLMSEEFLPPWLGGVAFLAILSATMSTLDAQILTLSSMLVRDGLPSSSRSPRTEVRLGRIFIFAVAMCVYVLSLLWGDSLFDISRRAFEGYTTLVPTLFLGVRWRRFSASGAIASITVANLVLWAGWNFDGFALFGFLPVFWAFVAGILSAVVVSLTSGPRESS
ncbi:MAG: hypothetical protein CMJ89_12675 [Planctomycetes bacterium]|nr:hypothetical protein [Planctomycetota bacterium]